VLKERLDMMMLLVLSYIVAGGLKFTDGRYPITLLVELCAGRISGVQTERERGRRGSV
jgi:hypothetical protein